MSVIDLFAGPGGWSEAARSLGILEVGIELDAAACATRAAAGHRTIRANVAAFPVDRIAERVTGCIGSPPCKLYSAAGTGIGRLVIDLLAAAIPRMLSGDDCRAEVREQVFPVALRYRQAENEARKAGKQWAAARLERAARSDAFEACLVLEPARYIAGIGAGLRWVALEQVPAVLPLWEAYATALRAKGFSAWAGKLNAADYGVPQTRERAILVASRDHRVSRPEPTHYDPRKGMQLWGLPWVSMAEALGWGATRRPVPTVTAGGTKTGGAEPFGHRGRDALEAERGAGEWALRVDAQAHASVRPATAPAPAPALKFGHSAAEMQWVLHTNRDQRPDGSRQTVDPSTAPAPALTAKSGGQWVVKFRNNNNNACVRSLDEPAGTLFFGQRSNWAAWVTEQPSPAITTTRRSRDGLIAGRQLPEGESAAVGGHGWDGDVTGSNGGSRSNAVRITVQEAAILQSFPADYPWQGTKTAAFTQVGNAVPPLLAEHVLAVATGLRRQECAAEDDAA